MKPQKPSPYLKTTFISKYRFTGAIKPHTFKALIDLTSYATRIPRSKLVLRRNTADRASGSSWLSIWVFVKGTKTCVAKADKQYKILTVLDVPYTFETYLYKQLKNC